MRRTCSCLAAVLVLAGGYRAFAKVELAPAFTDNAVLQRGVPVNVWGKASPGEKITLKFAGQSVETIAGSDGKWMLKLAPMKENKVAQSLEATGSANTVKINNLLVGEVWLCSGQSNMYQPVWSGNPRYRQIDGDKIAKEANYPLIRFVQLPLRWSMTPTDRPDAQWEVVSPANIAKMSAVGYLFGLELFKALDVPVGLIHAS
ncbi:MAG: hypothetical protein PHS41_02430, partial [Victivallaceae bacterium]|nr:hypothetical protein [Victivallaceae bacterium]